jgi:hypothetical protein
MQKLGVMPLPSALSTLRDWSEKTRERAQSNLRQWLNERTLRSCREVLPIRVHAPLLSLGDHFNLAVVLLHTCRCRGLVPHFRFTTPLEGAEEGTHDWLSPFYSQPMDGCTPESREVVITGWEDLGPAWRVAARFERESVARMIHSHFVVAASLRAKLDDFSRRRLRGRSTLGIHYRTGGRGEHAHQITPGEMLDSTMVMLQENPSLQQVLLASDSPDFASLAGTELSGRPVVFTTELGAGRADAAPGAENAGNRGPSSGAGGLLDALLLAECQHLLKAECSLSHWSKLINPHLPVTSLTHRDDVPGWAQWFPLDLYPAAPRRKPSFGARPLAA